VPAEYAQAAINLIVTAARLPAEAPPPPAVTSKLKAAVAFPASLQSIAIYLLLYLLLCVLIESTVISKLFRALPVFCGILIFLE
jgi:hypothetical protein